MNESDQRRAEISSLFGRNKLYGWVVRDPDEGAPHWEDPDFYRGVVSPPEGDATDGVTIIVKAQTIPDGKGGEMESEEQSRSARWEQIYRVASDHDSRHLAFLDSIPIRQLGAVLQLDPSSAQKAVIAAALRSYPGAIADEVQPALAALSDSERRALAKLAIAELEQNDGILRGLTLVLGLLGGPEDALKLGDRIVVLGEGDARWKFAFGLEALRLFNTRDAHMQIQRVAMQSALPPVISAARATLLHIAGDLGVPVWEVQDELVPGCGLDQDGHVALDFGPRHFDLVLDSELRPLLLERPGNARHYDLPAPQGEDDAAAVASARHHWEVVKEQLDEAVPVQAHRFEEALAQQTRWVGAKWRSAIQRHPLLVHLAPRAVWGTYSKGGRKLLDTFRIDIDRTLWGPDDEPYELDPERTIGLVHPLELSDEIRDAWGEILADYEVVTMFPQISRAIYRPPQARRKETSVDVDIHVPGDWALAHLYRRGWHEHEGWGSRVQKVFRNRDLKVVMSYQVLATETILSSVSFQRYLGYPKTDFQLRDVSEVPYSETLYELEQMRMPQETGGWPAVVSR